MKRKEIKLSLLLLAIFPLFMLANSIQADAASAVPVLQSPNVTIIDGSGNITGGNKDVNIRNAIPLSYVGSSMASDIKVLDSNGVLQSNVTTTTYAVGTTFKVLNAGYYNGKPVVFAFKSTNMRLRVFAMSDTTGSYVYPLPTGQIDNSNPRYEMWVEDADGNEIKDPNVQFVFPFKTMYAGSGVGSYMIWEFIAGGPAAGNLLIQNSTKDDALQLPYFSVDITSTYTRVIATMGSMYANYIFPAAGHVQLYSEPLSGTYPNGVPFTSKSTNNTYRFLNSGVNTLVPLYNAAPVVNNTVNDSTFQANVSITQSLYGQSSSSFYPNSLDITATLPDVLKTVDSIGSLKVTDQTGKDITSQVTMTSESNGTITVSIPQATLISLGSNMITIQGMVDIDRTNKNIASYYDSTTGYFVFPETAKNTDSDVTNSGEAKVKVPGPTADPVPQRVGQGTSTDNLLPRDLVTNLDSLVPDDVVTVLGFKEKKTFSTVGADTAIVQIKSQKTGIVSDITVPITVVGGSVVTDQANLSWSNIDIVSDRTEELSNASLSGTLSEDVYWQTSFTNKRYQLVVKKGTTILTQKLADSTSTGDNSWLKESLDIPLDQLSTGPNSLTIGIYALKADGSLLGGPLSFINLTVNVIADNATLSWIDNTSYTQSAKVESLDKSTMEESLVETLYWKTTVEKRNYLLVTKDSSGSVVTSQAVSNAAVINQFQQVTISFPTNSFNYGDNLYTVGIYAQDNTGVATGTALDVITLTVTVTGTLQLVSIPETIDFNLQTINSIKNVRVDNPTVTGELVIADTRDIIDHSWTVKVSLTKQFENISDTGKKAILQNVLRYKAPNKDEFIVTSDSQEIAAQTDAYGKYDISSQWGNTKDSAGFKFETPPAYIGQLGEYTGEITYTISETYEP